MHRRGLGRRKGMEERGISKLPFKCKWAFRSHEIVSVRGHNGHQRFNTELESTRDFCTFQLVPVARQPSPPSWGNCQIPAGPALKHTEMSLGVVLCLVETTPRVGENLRVCFLGFGRCKLGVTFGGKKDFRD